MALENQGSSRTYLNIKEGKIVIRKGDQIEAFDHVSGTITGINIHEGKFGKELHLIIVDGTEEYVLQSKLDGGYARGFMMAVKNADLKRPITLVPKYEEKDGKKKSTLFVNQGGKGLKWFWTKDNPGDLPKMECVELDGKKIWSSRKQMEFLENMLINEIKPNLIHAAVAAPADTSPAYKANDNEPDDLPF